MPKMIPLAKMSKKAKKEFYNSKRKDWGGLSPVTRVTKSAHDYKCRKTEMRGL